MPCLPLTTKLYVYIQANYKVLNLLWSKTIISMPHTTDKKAWGKNHFYEIMVYLFSNNHGHTNIITETLIKNHRR